MNVTDKMVEAFYSKVEVQRTGTIGNIKEGLAAALSIDRGEDSTPTPSLSLVPVAWRGIGSDGVSDVTERLDIADQWLADGLAVTALFAAASEETP